MSELASVIGTTQTSISRMLGENGNPTYDTLMRISEALEVGITELFSNESNTVACPKCGHEFAVEIKAKEE